VSWPVTRSRDLVRRLTLVTAPLLEPLPLVDATAHLRVSGEEENALIEALIVAARGHVERVTGRQLITATWKLKMERFPCDGEPIEIPVAPLLTVVSVKYRDLADALQTWASSEYVVDAPAGSYATTGRIYPALNKVYPTTADRPDAVEIDFTAGYGPNPEDVPQELRQALLLLVGHWFENRETVTIGSIPTELPFAAEALLSSFTRLAAMIR
jgi:uncharacterized phiE125 gp8 family phage protein